MTLATRVKGLTRENSTGNFSPTESARIEDGGSSEVDMGEHLEDEAYSEDSIFQVDV